jgi:hypothetical protein
MGNRPKSGRPPGRRGKGGTGPGPAYRPNPNTGGTRHEGGCCAMAAAVRALRQGKYRLARRYAALSLRLLAARVA